MTRIVQRAVAGLIVIASPLLAHTDQPIEPHDLWSAWSFDPGILIPVALSGILYLIGARRMAGLTKWEIACFTAGWFTLAAALLSPIHALGEALFSAHMLQHELLMAVAAPLLVLGRPLAPMLWGLPMRWRRTAGGFPKRRSIRFFWRWVTIPPVAWAIHAVVLWGWHAPVLFQATLRSDLVHSAQHASFLGSALLFWWALLRGRRSRGQGRMGYGVATLYVFTTAVHTSVLGALLTFAPVPWYPVYGGRSLAWGYTPLQDQQLGGLMMWIPGGVVYAVAGLLLFAAWIRESGSRAFEFVPNRTMLFAVSTWMTAAMLANRGFIWG